MNAAIHRRVGSVSRRLARAVTSHGRFEPRTRRLAPVARAEPRRGLGRDGAAEGVAAGRAAAGVEDGRRRAKATRRSAIGRRPALHARRARRHRVRAWRSTRRPARGSGRSRHGRRFSNDRGDGPRGTPTIDGDRVYAFGASGDLTRARCGDRQGPLDAVNVLQKFGGSNITWGLSESPLVLSDRILVNAGGRARRSSR